MKNWINFSIITLLVYKSSTFQIIIMSLNLILYLFFSIFHSFFEISRYIKIELRIIYLNESFKYLILNLDLEYL